MFQKNKGNPFFPFKRRESVAENHSKIPDNICEIPRDDLSGEDNYSIVELFILTFIKIYQH